MDDSKPTADFAQHELLRRGTAPLFGVGARDVEGGIIVRALLKRVPDYRINREYRGTKRAKSPAHAPRSDSMTTWSATAIRTALWAKAPNYVA